MGWTRTVNDRGYGFNIVWQNDHSRNKVEIIREDAYETGTGGKYLYTVDYDDKWDSFETQKDAIDFAINFMEANPDG